MYTEYEEFHKKYSAKYGSKTAIFLMVGSFYELYDIQDKETGETQLNVKEITDFLGIQLAIKRDDVGANKDALFAGFPEASLHKWAGRLTQAGWTVVVIDQIKDSKNKVVERVAARILSPSTHIENSISSETPYLTCILFQEHNMTPPSYGVASLDLTTGRTYTFSGQANGRQDMWNADDLVQYTSVFNSKEYIIYWRGERFSVPDEQSIRRQFGIPQSTSVHIRHMETLGNFSKELVRKEYLQKIYSIRSLLPPREYLGLRTEQEETSLLFLLQFIEEHFPSSLKGFQRNEAWNPLNQLVCGNHALTQLQMTAQNQSESVIGLFNNGITVMGKRDIRKRLLRPEVSPYIIRQRLKEVESYISLSDTEQKYAERQLRFLGDIPRLHRKILCATITSPELYILHQSYTAITSLMNSSLKSTPLCYTFSKDNWDLYKASFYKHIDPEKALSASEDVSPFSSTEYDAIFRTETRIKQNLSDFESHRQELCKIGNLSTDSLRLESREKEPFGIRGSRNQMIALQSKQLDLPKATSFSILKSGGWVDTPRLQTLNMELIRLREILASHVRTALLSACESISKDGSSIWCSVEEWVSHIDCTQCIAKTSIQRGFTCPTIVEESPEHGSYLDIKGLRHPLVESTSSRVEYVQHDISLGSNSYLIYGMNASGKSTLMKATGLAVLLAQAGSYVPAKSMILAPFNAVYTRILNQDNIFAGLSSFAVEMSELRDILRSADRNTLVLGDELCAGTESVSAQSLVSAGIKWLSKRHAKYIFATHLHDLPKLLDPSSLNLQIWHLHVEYNPLTKKLIYDRSLRPGSGSTLYGLEVARAMDLPFEFIEQALKDRHLIQGTTHETNASTSSWNSNIIRRECSVCKNQFKQTLEVHHINQRSSANTHGILPSGQHMNNERNLVVLCEACHDAHHRNELEIKSVKQTSEGPELTIERKSTSSNESTHKVKSSKWSDEELEEIHKYLRKYKTASLKTIRFQLETEYGILISESSLRAIRNSIN